MLPAAALAAAPAVSAPFRVEASQVQQAGGDIYTFYAERAYRPLWLDERGGMTSAAETVLALLDTAAYDQIADAPLKLAALRAALHRASASGAVADVTRAELLMSASFAAYVQALRAGNDAAMIYEHGNLKPQPLRAYHVLSAAGAAAVLDDYVGQMMWMHPTYAPLRRALITAPPADARQRQAAVSTLARIRGIPNARRHVLVDVASAQLLMYENGKVVDTMRVVVGKPITQTPLLAGYIRYAITNPYWNVPAELVRTNIAGNVLSRGIGYLKAGGYQVLSDWSDSPSLVDPRTIDWRAAAGGKLDLRVRQLPRPQNFMGKVKFEFPNPQGIYLHDTPQKDLMLRDARQLSNGCIRLEDAQRLGRWLMRGDLPPAGADPERKVDLPQPVPIYITYITAQAEDGRIALGPDPYGLEAKHAPGAAPRPNTARR